MRPRKPPAGPNAAARKGMGPKHRGAVLQGGVEELGRSFEDIEKTVGEGEYGYRGS